VQADRRHRRCAREHGQEPDALRAGEAAARPRRVQGPCEGRAVTSPGGSRDDDDGATGDDPKLRAMRAVWLEMRNEDPPDRGLTDLLAAARSKAAAMQPTPSAWQRLLAALRRPPAPALGTAMVLIAGAVLIGRRAPDERERGATTRSPPASGSGSTAAPGPRDAVPAGAAPSGVLAQPP